jgi:transglutaminase-like putative cysteine protease
MPARSSIMAVCLGLPLFLFAHTAKAGQKLVLDPELPYQAKRDNAVTHDVDFCVVVTPPYHCKVLKVWLPVPQSDLGQEVIGESDLSTFPENVVPKIGTEPAYGNKFAYFEFDQPQGAQIIRLKFKVKLWELHWRLAPEKVQTITNWPKSFEPFLKPQPIKSDKEFVAVLRSIVPKPSNPANDMFSVIEWIHKNLNYTHDKASLKADANFAFETRGGHCSDYHGLCATMGRALGYPTRITYGWTLVPKNSPSHCRMEAYLPPYGWVSFDVSETQQMLKRIQTDPKLDQQAIEELTRAARDRLFGGFRENSWLLLTKGRDYQLEPKALAPVTVVRTAYVEADGEVLPDPDPANTKQRQFGWMTVHHYVADRPFARPFTDYSTLKPSNK